MPGPSDEVDLPADWTGGDSQARPHKSGSAKVKAVAVLMVMAIVGLSYLRFGPLTQNDGGGLPGEEKTLPVFLDVKGDKTISGKNMTVKGDIIIQDGASLTISGCNITMNGTFRVNGALAIRGSTISDYPAPLGFSGSKALTILSNLTGCKRAWLNFTVQYDQTLAEILHASASVGNGATSELWGAGKKGPEKVSLDLSAFCGAVVKVDMDPSGASAGFSILEPVMTTDTFMTPTIDLMVKSEGTPYRVFDDPYPVWRPFNMVVDGGILEISNSTVESSGGYGRQIWANYSEISVTDARFKVTDASRHGDVQFIKCDRSRLTVRSCEFSKGGGIWAVSSNVVVSDSLFQNEGAAIMSTGSALDVDRCRVFNCSSCIMAETVKASSEGTVSIRNTQIESNQSYGSGIKLQNMNGSVDGCIIQSPVPMILVPPAAAGNGNGSLMDLSRITGNTFITSQTGSYQKSAAAVTIFSGVPLAGMDELVARNSWNATEQVARYLLIKEIGYDQDGWRSPMQYHRKGSAVEFDGSMRIVRESPFDEGWTGAVSRYSLPSMSFTQLYELDYDWAVPMEKFSTVQTGYCWTRADPDSLDIMKQNVDGTGTTEVDLNLIRGPLDIVQLQIPIVPPPFDMGLSSFDVAYYQEAGAPLVSAALEIEGLTPPNVNVTIKLDGRTVDSWEGPPWSSTMPLYLLDTRTLATGNLSISVSAPGRIEMDMADNILTVPVTVVNESTTLESAANISGIWFLKTGVNINFSNCSLAANGSGAFFIGEGFNHIDIRGCALNITYLRFFNCSGTIRDSEIFQVTSEQYAYARFTVESGSWELDNFTFGSRHVEFDRMEREYQKDPSGVMERSYDDKLDWVQPYNYLSFNVDDLICRNSSVYGDGCSLYTNSTLILSGCRFLICSPRLDSGGNITLAKNSFSFTSDIHLVGSVDARNNTFSDVIGGVNVDGMPSAISIAGNEFISHPFSYEWGDAGIVFLNAPTVFEANLFKGLYAAVDKNGPFTGLAALLPDNTFSDIGFAQAYSRKSVEFQLNAQDYEELCLRFNRKITIVHLYWNDSHEAKDTILQSFYFYSQDPSNQQSFYDWFVDPDGVEKKVDALEVNIVVEAPSGAKWSAPMRIDVPAGESYTVDIR
jgi:hypothetical protein